MNSFTKEELIEILDFCECWEPDGAGMSEFRMDLYRKLKSMVDSYNFSEKVIFHCSTVLAVGDNFFCTKQYMDEEDLFIILNYLMKECDGKIKKPGLYKFSLQIDGLKL